MHRLLPLVTALACLLSATAPAAAQVRAVIGQPFGVGELTLVLPPAEAAATPADSLASAIGRSTFTLEGPAGRVLYPAFSEGLVRRLLGGARSEQTLTVAFLFRGTTPFDITISTPARQTVRVVPMHGRTALAHRRMLQQWWRGYHSMFRELGKRSAHPPLVETYLTTTLARRLGLNEPLVDRVSANLSDNPDRRALGLLLGTPAARMRVLEATALGQLPVTAATDQPLPAAVDWQLPALPAIDGDVDIEPMAMRVPAECFYVRFGQFSNYLWLSALLRDYGGEIGNMISARSFSSGLTQRIQDQLVLQEGVLTRLLGPQAIADFAIIGMDTFAGEGIAVGVVFEATGMLVGVDLARQRQEALEAGKAGGATLETVTIADKDVSFLATPDNRLRSFHVVDGNYHLVTNCRAIVERFLAVRDGQGSVGASGEFRYARSLMPRSRQDTIFAYVPSAFFRNVLGPRYQIELQRRWRAATDIDLIQLARLAANAEGVAGTTVGDLVSAELLPGRFAARPDQGRPVETESGWLDSLRGRRGVFTPVPDVPVEQVSAEERRWYEELAGHLAANWQRMDPVFAALKRTQLADAGAERITFDAMIAPMHEAKYKRLTTLLAEPSADRLAAPDGGIVLIDAALQGGERFPNVPPHRLLLGIQDRPPLAQSPAQDVLKLRQMLRTAPGYLGAWPKPGFLDMIPPAPWLPGDDEFLQLPLGLLRWQGNDFSLLGFDQDILSEVGPRLKFEPAEQPAQIRVHVGDLSKAAFRGWLNQMAYERARLASVNTVRLMSALTQQLRVPPDESRTAAQRLIDAEFICTLGGTYEIVQHGTSKLWRSTAWPATPDYAVPADYQSPILTWFRGLDAQLLQQSDRIVVQGQLDMTR
ncbi:MAG: hypothetical protein FJ276_25830 [Planctomycetes bacterium]|nr:hypothetical protein [Planctomycetota bacterium]